MTGERDMSRWLIVTLFMLALSQVTHATDAPPDAELYFISPKDGQSVENPVTVRFGLRNMGVAPAGVKVKRTGHHHLIVDTDLPDLEKPVPSDKQHRHFGGGQTETELELSPGAHTLQLLLGDHAHRPHNPPIYSDRITITVKQ